ncbi:hypothetical protein PV327_010663 [Microctonus hyperodae]|uniref:EndoU domain-containing protein n=1 Tax=Microctonus hyperodae TaxID=165561 RepID=A0AA39C8A1_MICHY|nr:hypothetical protein PV327_010663 [Microctonus hyperodae]
MKTHLVIILITLTIFISCNSTHGRRSGGSSRRTGSSSSSSGSRGSWTSRNPTSRPTQHQSSGGSNPGKIGWNIPSKQPTSVNKPSAPNSEHISKTSATNVQSSGYQPSGGYGQNTGGAFGQQSAGHSPSVPYPPVGSRTNGGYGTPGGQPPSYGTAIGQHPPSYGTAMGHPPSYGTPNGAYQSHGQSYHPPQYNSHNPGYQQPAYQPNAYNPSYGHSYTPGAGYNPPVGGYSQPQTIFVQSGQSSRPGIGQLAKEAFVYAGVSAGVNAVVNRVLPGGIHNIPSHSYGSAPAVAAGVPGATHTEITYNNYYNNGTPGAVPPATVNNNQPGSPQAPASSDSILPNQSTLNSNVNPPQQSSSSSAAAPAAAVGTVAATKPVEEELKFTSPMGRDTFKREIEQLSEELLTKDSNNLFKHITMKLQGQKIDGSITDDAPDNLLTVNDAAWEMPIIKAVLALYDNYELDAKTKEIVSDEEREEESRFINAIVDTEVMKRTMNFLMDKGYISDDVYEFKNALKRIWFTQFKRSENDAGSSGFETVFLAEKIDSEIIGLHNWIYYAKKEADKQLNYLGYIQHTSLGDKGAMVKVRSRLNDTPQDVTTLFVGTSPELEMSLYTMCFYISPNYPCPIKLAGNEFIISTSRVIYFDKDILVSAYPELWIPPPVQNSISTDKHSSPDMTDRRSNASLNAKSSGKSQLYSTLFLTIIHLLILSIITKLF